MFPPNAVFSKRSPPNCGYIADTTGSELRSRARDCGYELTRQEEIERYTLVKAKCDALISAVTAYCQRECALDPSRTEELEVICESALDELKKIATLKLLSAS